MGRGEVLELVDEHADGTPVVRPPWRRVGRAGPRSPGRSGRRSRRHLHVRARRGTSATPRRGHRRRRRTAVRPRPGRRDRVGCSAQRLDPRRHRVGVAPLRRSRSTSRASRRTSGSSIVRHDRAWARNGGTPLTMASAIELSVRTCSPRRSAVRWRISSWARLLKATRLTALGGSRQPDEQVAGPFGEHSRLAGPGRGDDAGRATGVGDCRQLVGGEVGARGVGHGSREGSVLDGDGMEHGSAVDRIGDSEPARRRATPSIPSGSTTSAAPPNTAPSATARSTSSHFSASGSRASMEFDHTRWCSSSPSNANRAPNSCDGLALDGRRRGVIDQFDHDATPFEGGRSQTLDGGQGLAHGCRVDAGSVRIHSSRTADRSLRRRRRCVPAGADLARAGTPRPRAGRCGRPPAAPVAPRPDRDVPRQPVGRPARCAPSTV